MGGKKFEITKNFYQNRLTVSVEENHAENHAQRVPVVDGFVCDVPHNPHVDKHPRKSRRHNRNSDDLRNQIQDLETRHVRRPVNKTRLIWQPTLSSENINNSIVA